VKVFQDLNIGPLSGEQEQRLIESVEARLDEGWDRDEERENDLRRSGLPGVFCFICSKKQDRQSAALILAPKEKGGSRTLYVSNIVPADVSELGYDQYNQILREFHDNFLAPAAKNLHVAFDLTAPDTTIENVLSSESLGLLKSFSRSANKSTGSSHPMDRKRWFNFLIYLHRSEEKPDEGLLKRWLVEEEGWPEDKAWDLMIEYEYAQGLLDEYDR
jgi:hypothetical protein